MKLVEIEWNPKHRQLRQFGGVCLFALPGIGWMWGGGAAVVAALAILGIALAIVGLIWPRGIKPVFLTLMIVAIPLGTVIGELAMLCVYFGVFLPIGIGFRVMGRDALQLKPAQNSTSYWRPKRQPRNVGSYYRQS